MAKVWKWKMIEKKFDCNKTFQILCFTQEIDQHNWLRNSMNFVRGNIEKRNYAFYEKSISFITICTMQ